MTSLVGNESRDDRWRTACHRILLDEAPRGRNGRVAFVGRLMRRSDAIVILLNTMSNREVFKAVFSERLVGCALLSKYPIDVDGRRLRSADPSLRGNAVSGPCSPSLTTILPSRSFPRERCVVYLGMATFEASDLRSMRSDSQASKPGDSTSPTRTRRMTSCTPGIEATAFAESSSSRAEP